MMSEMFVEIFKKTSKPIGTEEKSKQIVSKVVAERNASMPRAKNNAHRLSKPWRNNESL